jgi:ABC-2 type transport system permease protein
MPCFNFSPAERQTKYNLMKKFYAFVQKEFYHIFRDTRTMMILFALPIALVIIFGYALNNDFKNIPIGILNQSKDQTSEKLIHRIIGSGYFVVEQTLEKPQDIPKAFKSGKVKLVVFFPTSFQQDLYHTKKAQVQLIADASDINTAINTTSYLSGIIGEFNNENGRENSGGIQLSTRMIFNQRLLSVYLFIPGVIALILLIISALLTSVTLAREKETGTLELLSISPISPYMIIIGKVIPYLILSLLNSFLIILLGIVVFGLPMVGSVALLVLACFVYTVASLSLGILISTRVETQQAAMFASLVSLMMPTMLLSGFIFPIESLPLPLQFISNIIPATHFIILIKSIMIKGAGITLIWKPFFILIVMTAVFILVSIQSLKRNK